MQIGRTLYFPVNDFEVVNNENWVRKFDSGLFTIDFDHPIVTAKLHEARDENVIHLFGIFSDRLPLAIPGFTAKPGGFLNFSPRFILVAFIDGHIKVSDGCFGVSIVGYGIFTKTTENGDLIQSSAHGVSSSIVKLRF